MRIERFDVGVVVLDVAGREPLVQPIEEELIGEVYAPERRESDAGFDERAIEV